MLSSTTAHPSTAAWLTCRKQLYRWALRWAGGRASDAEDLLAEAYLRMLEIHRERGEDVRCPLAFCRTVIANLGRDSCRFRARRQIEALSDLPAGGRAPDELAEFRELLARASSALSGLTPAQRAALVLRGSGAEYPEIAAELSTSLASARKLVQNGRDSLRQALQVGARA